MMERLWQSILHQYGQKVTLRSGEKQTAVRALVQPWLDSGTEQAVSGPLGLERRDRFRYLGPGNQPLDLDTVVEWNSQEYQVRSAHLVGEGICPYWWAVLYPREETVL